MTNWIRFLAFAFCAIAAGAEQPSHFSPLKQIRTGNVQQLKLAWTYRTGEPLAPARNGGRPPAFEPTPLYADGLLYIGTPYGRVIALEPETGKERWSYDSKIELQASYGDFANRGVAYWADSKAKPTEVCARRIFFASIDARLIAVDAATGAVCTAFGDKGQINLTAHMRRGPEYTGEVENTSPPAVIDDLVIVGSAIADNHRSNSPTGEVRAFDARSGRLQWKWDPLPKNPDAGGANTW